MNKNKRTLIVLLIVLLIIGILGGVAIHANYKKQKEQEEYDQILIDTLKGIVEFEEGIDKAKSRLK